MTAKSHPPLSDSLSGTLLHVSFSPDHNLMRLPQTARWVKNLPAVQELQERGVGSLDSKDPLEEEMAAQFHSLVWKLPVGGGAWCITVHRVAELDRLSMHDSQHSPEGQRPQSCFTARDTAAQRVPRHTSSKEPSH